MTYRALEGDVAASDFIQPDGKTYRIPSRFRLPEASARLSVAPSKGLRSLFDDGVKASWTDGQARVWRAIPAGVEITSPVFRGKIVEIDGVAALEGAFTSGPPSKFFLWLWWGGLAVLSLTMMMATGGGIGFLLFTGLLAVFGLITYGVIFVVDDNQREAIIAFIEKSLNP